jgi:hypothetical protein
MLGVTSLGLSASVAVDENKGAECEILGSHGGEDVCVVLGCDAVWTHMWKKLAGLGAFCSEFRCNVFFETFVSACRSTRRYKPEDQLPQRDSDINYFLV